MSRYFDEVNRQVENHMNCMSRHVLTTDNDGLSYRMGRPGSNAFSVYLIFAHGRIGITGDFCPGHNGVFSDLRYSANWFASDLSGGYLASKFLEKKWQKECVIFDAKDYLEDARNLDESWRMAEFYKAILNEYEDELTPEKVYSLANHYGIESEDLPGHEYPISDIAALIAIQRKFKELYAYFTTQKREGELVNV